MKARGPRDEPDLRGERDPAHVKVFVDAPTHLKTRMLAEALDIDETRAFGALVRLWVYLPGHHSDGVLDAFALDWLPRIMGLPEVEAEDLRVALIVSRLVDLDGGVLRVHDWTSPPHTGAFYVEQTSKSAHQFHASPNRVRGPGCVYCDRHFEEHLVTGEFDPDNCSWCRLDADEESG
jgi:hypothetical protein